ncbi:MAG: DMT family transporter [Candidatus Eisenbacteria bacterium]
MTRPASREGTGLLLVVGACILWGTSATLARYTMGRNVPPLVVVELRLMLSVLVLAVGFALLRPALFRIGRRDVLPLFILGTVGIAAVQGTYYTNVSWVGVGLAILLQYLAPALVVAWEALRERRWPPAARLLALGLATAGVALLVLADGAALARANPAGVALGLASAAFYAFYILYAKRLVGQLSAWTVLFYGFLVAGLFWMLFVPPWTIAAARYPATTWGLLAVIALTSALVPFALFFSGLERVAAARAGIVSLLEPIVAIGSAALFLGERLTPVQGVGALLILAGVGWVAISERGRGRGHSTPSS